MSDDDETPTARPTPPIPPPEGEPTISVEEDAAGELHEAPTVEAPALEQPVELCGAPCGSSAERCKLGKGHEEPKHPDHLTNQFGEPQHMSDAARWSVDAEAAEAAGKDRMRQLLENAQATERAAKGD